MRILHYTLGLPPYRSGGLTKYTIDLMNIQQKYGNNIILLFPGKMRFLSNNNRVQFYRYYEGISVYELVNPLPVPLLDGVKNPHDFMAEGNIDIYIEFLKEINVDIINIHTLMGLHKEFLDAAKLLEIKIVFTTHDYYGLCPKVNFIDYNGDVCTTPHSQKCLECNKNGKSIKTIKFMQSPLYRYLKNDMRINHHKNHIKKLLNYRKTINESSKLEILSDLDNIETNMEGLLNYYKEMYKAIDYFIFNSSVTKDVYSSFLDVKGEIINITHADIVDNRKIKLYESNDGLNVTYLGGDRLYKGFNLLLDIFLQLYNEGNKGIKLSAYGVGNQESYSENIFVNKEYFYEDLAEIFENTDVLIVPSICNETFGFITIEALSFGVPVIVTDTVGSKDILLKSPTEIGIIIKPDADEIKKLLIKLNHNKNLLKKINRNILNNDFSFNLEVHYLDVINVYKKILGV